MNYVSRFFSLCKCLWLLVCLQNIIASEAAECELPGGARGECVALSACAPYLALLQESTTTELGLRLTQERRCGLQGNDVKVCCPTEAEVPKPRVPDSEGSDYVDELPQPGLCGPLDRGYTPYIFSGKAVQSRLVFEGVLSSDSEDIITSNPQEHPTAPFDESSNTPAWWYREHARPTRDVLSSDGRPIPDIGAAVGGKPVMGHGMPTLPMFSTPVSGGLLVSMEHRDSITEEPTVAAPEISGGEPVAEEHRQMARWMALLAYEGSPSVWECGGSIITERHVLTAAHCIRKSLYIVRVGELDFAKQDAEFGPQDFYVKKKIPHENYTKYHNDIAIVVVNGTIPIGHPFFSKYIAPVCLPTPGVPRELTSKPFITGWGETEKIGERPTHLLYAYLNILEQKACREAYKSETLTIDERVFCAGDPRNGRDACNGDSGGPLIGQYFIPTLYSPFYYQVGVISYGYRCSAQRFTGVYTNVTHFMPWIMEKVIGKAAASYK